MALRSPVTVIPELVGLAPAVTLTVSSVVFPACIGFGFADPVPVGGVGASTVSGIVALPERNCASVIVALMDLLPPLVPVATVVVNENTLSPPITSPCVPSSKNC